MAAKGNICVKFLLGLFLNYDCGDKMSAQVIRVLRIDLFSEDELHSIATEYRLIPEDEYENAITKKKISEFFKIIPEILHPEIETHLKTIMEMGFKITSDDNLYDQLME